MMLSVAMTSFEGNDDAVMSYGGLVDRDTIHGRDVQFLYDDDVVDDIERRDDEARRYREWVSP